MSYVCLLANEQGAAAAGDSRITISGPFGLHFHHDQGTKVFASASRSTIWATAGITRVGIYRFPVMVGRIMKEESLPLSDRLHRVEKLMCLHTRRLEKLRKINRLPIRIFAACLSPLSFLPPVKQVRQKLLTASAKPQLFNLIYSGMDSQGHRKTGAVCVVAGKYSVRNYSSPVIFVENGMNMKSLSSARAYIPSPEAATAEMERLARKRVQESIDRDRELKRENPRYLSTIGGKVRSVVTG